MASEYASVWHHYRKVGSVDRMAEGKNGVIILVHLNTTPPKASWHNVGFMLAPKACECGSNQIETQRIPFEDTPFDWKRVADDYGRWAWYRGTTTPLGSKDATAMATSNMLFSSKQWDVYVGAGRGVIDAGDMIYSSATTSEVEFYYPEDEHK